MGATEAHELKLYIDNDASLHRQQHVPILKNLASKKSKRQYKHDLAVKAFGHLAESGAKKYVKEFGSPGQAWHTMFDAATRKIAAEDLTRDFEAEFELGNYDQLLPKSKPRLMPPQHAKKIAWRTPESLRVEWSVPNSAYFALWPTSAPVARQQVLKIADANAMDSWLRETYGAPYGRATGGATGRAHSTITKRHTFASGAHEGHFCTMCGGDRADSGHYVAAMPNMPKMRSAQLDREIADVVPSWRGGR